MKVAKNRERILKASIELFNQEGVVAVTTNHIAKHLQISPGNLYFHFRNKEEIVRELFHQMCTDTYAVWTPLNKNTPAGMPVDLIEKSFDVFLRYRFFHREMYHLRRKDPLLSSLWRTHIRRTMRLLKANYHHWVKLGLMKAIKDPQELQMIGNGLLMTSSTFLQFFENKDRPATRRSIKPGIQHVTRFLLPYYTESRRHELLSYLNE